MITINDVTKSYIIGGNQVNALNNVSLEISEGDFMAVTGPSGSGKSTLLYTLGGLLTPNVGRVTVNESDIYSLSQRLRARFRRENVGFIFQTFELLPYLTALENVMLPLSINGINGREQEDKASDSLEKVGLDERADHKPTELSGGEQQRVAVARGLVNDPKILLADEPTGNLDQKTGDGIMSLLSDLNEEGQTIVFVTHDLSRTVMANKDVGMIDGGIITVNNRDV
ncbi:ABC transporter ATP-binding protein [Candidatus Bathyarchaeota archaeon]|jgi:putative ABC transport system ATP-binding protein|nr:ABC transporter ATP-binding protein [Candidatus Bathyarchaeota archaeon]MBT4320148.1 ABC transporter ATP-binding protein [Candidatus Bathyarchaeota archaeon]MBT4424798.1 ABC transporter ATP-binding protein [Candidatus Bathyarchaeota archaeon]MBT6603908.1 ABC transporter ATP-binding protein [Candidatus Bathyarchaeota archaeon]MBT7188011.1 ABC transporter ATP-binding protein [Candidatus Bathyarchaeota archaeon]